MIEKQNNLRKKELTIDDNQNKTYILKTNPQQFNQKGSEKVVKFLFYTIVLLIIFIFLGMTGVVLKTGKLVNQIKSLPSDFPEIPLYLPHQAIIKKQSQAQQQQAINLIEALPNWFVTLLINKISVDAKTQILLINQKEKIYDANSLKNSLKTTINYSKIFSLKWKNINKTKEDLVDYYIQKLKLSGFSVIKEKRGGEILLVFSKAQIQGIFLITDNFKNSNSSQVILTVVY